MSRHIFYEKTDRKELEGIELIVKKNAVNSHTVIFGNINCIFKIFRKICKGLKKQILTKVFIPFYSQ
jgi:hypothetical protein